MLDFGSDILHRNQKDCQFINMGEPSGFYLVGANITYTIGMFFINMVYLTSNMVGQLQALLLWEEKKLK